jgi:hypothetical protein
MTLTEIADRLKALLGNFPNDKPFTPDIVASDVELILADISDAAIRTRLQKLVDDYPHGIPPEAISIEVRRVTELAHMVKRDLV